MNIKHSIGLNLSADAIPGRLHMVQGDANSRTIVATLWDGAQLYSIPAGAAVMVRFRKPDGTGGLYDATESGNKVSYAGSIVTAPVATQMLAVAGDVFAEIDIFGGGAGAAAERLATFRFVVEVAPCVLPDAEIISSDYYNILASKVAEAVAAAERAEQAQSAAAASAEAAATSAANAATSVEGAVKYNTPQTLTDEQKQQARDNIGAPAPYTAGENISISGSVIATKAFPCNPNLLDNWYFGHPVNQRGASGTISTAGYFFDRWKLVSGSVTINSGGIVLNGTIAQMLEYAVGQTVTATVLTPDGVTDVTPIYDDETKTFTVTTQGKTIRAVKLELGSQQTLAHQDADGNWVLNEIPKVGEQLAACQRYYQRLKASSGYMRFGTSQPYTDTAAGVFIPLQGEMRTTPTMSSSGNFALFEGSVFHGVTLSLDTTSPYNAILKAVGTGLPGTSGQLLANADENAYIEFSADL